ncbi:MAG: hypothetical protein ACXW4E_04530 [Anaerolineales bacterium]
MTNTPSLLGTTNRTDATVQVTYNVWPLYYYEKYKAPGDGVGQDVGGVWYLPRESKSALRNTSP